MVLTTHNQGTDECSFVNSFLSALDPEDEALMPAPVVNKDLVVALKKNGLHGTDSTSGESWNCHQDEIMDDNSCIVLDEVTETFQTMMVANAAEYAVMANADEEEPYCFPHGDDNDDHHSTAQATTENTEDKRISSISLEEIEVVYGDIDDEEEDELQTDRSITLVSCAACSDDYQHMDTNTPLGKTTTIALDQVSTAEIEDLQQDRFETQSEELQDDDDDGYSTSISYTPLVLRIKTDTSALEGGWSMTPPLSTNVWVPPPVCNVGSM